MCRPGLTLKCQAASFAVKSPSQARQVTGASARVEAAIRMDRPHGQAAAIRLVLRRVVPAGVCSSCRHRVIAFCRS